MNRALSPLGFTGRHSTSAGGSEKGHDVVVRGPIAASFPSLDKLMSAVAACMPRPPEPSGGEYSNADNVRSSTSFFAGEFICTKVQERYHPRWSGSIT